MANTKFEVVLRDSRIHFRTSSITASKLTGGSSTSVLSAALGSAVVIATSPASAKTLLFVLWRVLRFNILNRQRHALQVVDDPHQQECHASADDEQGD